MRALKILLAGSFALFVSGTAFAQDRPRVVAVNYALQYFAERLLADSADVVFPVPADQDPSFWRPSIADISMIQSSDLILLNGAGFATWVDRVSLPRSKLVNTSAAIQDRFIVTESITHSHGEGGEHSHEGLASYVWLDPSLAIAQAEAIAAAITARNLASAEDVAAQMDMLRTDLEILDRDARSALAALKDTAIIATHPRYEYFASRYGLSVQSLEWEAGTTPTDAEVAQLQALVDKTQARILIWEAAPPAGAFDIATSIGLQNIVFAPLAHSVEGRTFLDAYRDVIAAMTEAGVH